MDAQTRLTARQKLTAAKTLYFQLGAVTPEAGCTLLDGWMTLCAGPVGRGESSQPACSGQVDPGLWSLGHEVVPRRDQDRWRSSIQKLAVACSKDTAEILPKRDFIELCRWLEHVIKERRRIGDRLFSVFLGLLWLAGITTTAVVQGSEETEDLRRGWRATYVVPDTSKRAVRIVDALAFNWGRSSPLLRFPKNRFRVTFEGCLHVAEQQDLLFELGSDDGSRLYIDGQKEIDLFDTHLYESRKRLIPLGSWDECRFVEPSSFPGKTEYSLLSRHRGV